MEHVTKSDELRTFAEQVIEETPELHWIRDTGIQIGYLVSDKKKVSSGKICYGECRKVSDREKAYNPNDFDITFYETNTATFSPEQKRILMVHELMHVGVDINGNPRIVPHDVEDFAAIIDKYGYSWAGSAD